MNILSVVHLLNGILGVIIVVEVDEAEASAPAIPHDNGLLCLVSTRHFKPRLHGAGLTAFWISPNSLKESLRACSSVDHDRLLYRSARALAQGGWSLTHPT